MEAYFQVSPNCFMASLYTHPIGQVAIVALLFLCLRSFQRSPSRSPQNPSVIPTSLIDGLIVADI